MLFNCLTALFAQAAAAAPSVNPAVSQAASTAQKTVQPPAGSMLQVVLMISVFLIIMWFLFILPKKNQTKQAQKMVESLKKNVRVMTYSGIIGTVYSVDKEQNEVVLKVDDNTKIRFSLSAIYFVYNDDKEAKESKDEKKS